jgi:tRNA dimethylallyltransferase
MLVSRSAADEISPAFKVWAAISVAVNTKLPLIDGKRPRVALIAGPTASGKSDLALALAKLTPATIINADASQVYRDLRILSARPSVADEAAAPHRLFGHIDGAVACSAAEWAHEAKTAIGEAITAGRLPILVGGTGLYLRTLLDGIAPVPEIDPAIRADVRRLDVSAAYAALRREDPANAARLAAGDSTRVARALEVMRSTGRSLKSWQVERVGGIGEQISLAPMILLPPRDWLFARCDTRFATMLERGGIDEIQALLARRLDPALPVMCAIGVREVCAILDNPANAEQQINLAKIATRQYAKRQFTWFRNQFPADWPRVECEINTETINNLAIKLRDMTLT